MNRPDKLWNIRWTAFMVSYPDNLWVLATSAEKAAGKARKFLKKLGNTSIQIKTVEQQGTIDVF